MSAKRPYPTLDAAEVAALAYYLAAVDYDERGRTDERDVAERECLRARKQIEEARDWYAGTWIPLPSQKGSDHA